MPTSDFRSDTVTRPTDAMRASMAAAEVGDDVYGEDPTVNRLERRVSELLGKESALWLCSGTQANLAALLSHCQRGDEYIVGQQGHCYRFEGGGAAVLGGIQPQPLPFTPEGKLDPGEIVAAIKPLDPHYARTRLVCIENTQAGRVLTLEYLRTLRALCDRHSLALHLDGARLGNAAVASGESLADFAACCDSLTLCLSKGLGAPAGTMLAGSRDFIVEARRWRKVLGGGLRQVGIYAAAGLHALEHHLERLVDDHRLATELASALAVFPLLGVDPTEVTTNMVFARPDGGIIEPYRDFLDSHQVKVGGYGVLRFVTHMDVNAADVARLVRVTEAFFATSP